MSPTPETVRPNVLSVLAHGFVLWRRHAGRLFALYLPFTLAVAGLALLMRYGLYGTFVERADFSTGELLRPTLPWDAQSIQPFGGPYPGPFGQIAGLLGILAGVVSLLGELALVRALSLSFHGHGAPFNESVRTGAKRFGPALVAMLRQATYVLGWPLLAALLWFFGGEALRLLLGDGTIRRALDASMPILVRIGLAGIALFALYRVIRSMFTLPALVDQGVDSKAALDESLRLTKSSLALAVGGVLLIVVVSVVLDGVLAAVVGGAVGSLGRTPEVSTVLLAMCTAVGAAILTPLARSLFYVLYRSFLVLKGGARR